MDAPLSADRHALDAKDLFEEVMKLSNGDMQANDQTGVHEVHGRLAAASVQLRLARLDLATAKAKGAAFADCVPRTWQETTEAPSSASQSLSAALASGACAKAAERLLFRLEALGRHAAASGRRGAKLRMEMCEVACVALRCAAAVASVLDAGLVGENASIEATKKLEAQFKRVEQKTKELMHKKWPLDSPSQALNCLQEVETLTSEVLKGGLSVRGLCYQFQRFQVAFAYGVASKRATKDALRNQPGAVEAPPTEAAKAAQEEKAEEDGAMAALMRLQNRKKTPQEAPEAEAPVEAAPVPQEVKQLEDFQEDLWPEMELRLQVAQQTGGQHRAAESELQRLGKGIEVGLGKCATGEEEGRAQFRCIMAKHHPDLIMCRKQCGIAIGRLCEKCDGKCVICDSYVRPSQLARVCDECNYGSYQGRCVICGGAGISDAFYCKECCQCEKDRDGCPKIVNLGTARTDLFYERKKYGFKSR
eukprot:s4374_g1.t1